MTDKVFVSLRSSGTPVSLSTGIPLYTRKLRVAGCGFATRSYGMGGFDNTILIPGYGPDVAGWNYSRYTPPGHPFTADALDKVDRGRPLDFAQLSTPEVFWTRDDRHGEWVIMDAWSRRLVRVSPLEEQQQRGFWKGISTAYKQVVDNNWQFLPSEGADVWTPVGGFDPLHAGGVWLALHPAPYHEGQPVVWTFDGPRTVMFDVTPPPGSPEHLRICDEELFGVAPFKV